MVQENEIQNFSKEIYTKDKTLGGITVAKANISESKFSILGNLYVCRGEPGKVSVYINIEELSLLTY